MNQARSTSEQLPPEGSIIFVNNIQLYYEEYGEGTPLILLHGFTQTSQLWQPFIVEFTKHFRLIIPDMRGHGRSTNTLNEFTHWQSALDMFALLDQIKIERFKAIGFSSGGETLIHMATQQPDRVEAMVLIGASSYWTKQARDVMSNITVDSEFWDWENLRQQHIQGDNQIRTLINQLHDCKDSYDDMNFTAPYLSTITAKTLLMYGDRDPFCPVSLVVEMYTAIPEAYMWIVPNGDHGPFGGERAEQFTQTTLKFLGDEWGKTS
jgi:pimeloyl-ACP methyl ester carboxylesterase